MTQLVGARARAKGRGHEAGREICELGQGHVWVFFLSLLSLVMRDKGLHRRCGQRTHSVFGTEQVEAALSDVAG
jgi:hypothetical protein